jgi:hypothetical protein
MEEDPIVGRGLLPTRPGVVRLRLIFRVIGEEHLLQGAPDVFASLGHPSTVPKSPPISPARRRTIVPAGIPIVAHNRNYGFIVAVGRNYPESGAGQV